MESLQEQLKALGPQIEQVLRISGSPSLSLGVLHRGSIIHTAHFGCRNANESAPPDDDTLHSAASLTKPMTAAAVAQLVHEGKLDWNVPIRNYLPAFRVRRDELGMKATIRDLLSLRTGIAPANSYWGFQNNELLIDPSQIVPTSTYIGTAKPYGQFVYSQWNYALIGEIVREVTGMSIAEYITQHIFHPLNMTRSSFNSLQEDETNIAHTHCTHNDGAATRKPDATSNINAGGISAGGGARCSTKDYLFFAQALLGAYNAQKEHGVDHTPDSIFPLTKTVFTPHVGMGPPQNSGIDQVAYCLGMYRTKLPGFLSLASPNFYYTLFKRLPAYGKTLAGMEVFHQSGTALGHAAALFLVPETQSAVVAFTNSQPLMDPVDFAAQLALAVLLGEKPGVDFVKSAELARTMTFRNYHKLKEAVAQGKTDVPPTKSLDAYVGDYYNAIHNFVLSVTVTGNNLTVKMQYGDTGFVLSPYDGDTFYWPVDREEEMCSRGMWGFMYKDWHLFNFAINSNNEVESVSWKHDPYVASPETFKKTPSIQAFARL